MNILTASVPIFSIILIGYILTRVKLFNEEGADFLARLIFYVIMPVTLFFDISNLPISQTLQWPYMLAYFVTSIFVIMVSIVVFLKFFRRNLPNLILNAMASTHTNTAYFAIPLFLLVFKTATPVVSIIIVQSLFNFLILFGLDLTAKEEKQRISIYSALSVFLKNPILIGIIAGVIFSYFNLSLPLVVRSTFSMVSQSASFVALLALGLSFGVDKIRLEASQKFEIIVLIFFKSILHPLVAFLVGYYLFHLHGFTLMALVLMAAMPTAKNLFIFSKRYQIGVERANIVVLATTIISVVTINIVMALMST